MKAKAEERRIKARVYVRMYVAKGYSANRIQRELQKRGLGFRRKDLLKMVREVRGEEYRRLYAAKRVALYGAVEGESRRLEIYGSGKQLYRAMQDAVEHPPKKRWVTCHAKEVGKFLDWFRSWDYRPEVLS